MTPKQLGQTTRPTELIPGSPDDIHATASKLESRADRIHTVALSLWRLDVKGVWEGDAATSFERAAEQLQPHFDFAEEADRTASSALHSYANALEDAQVNAARAIDVWRHGQHATDAAKRDQAVALSGAGTELLFDPGEAQRANAERILQIARDEVSDAGNRAASALHNAQSLRPPAVGFWDGVAGTAGDVLRGIGNSVASLGNAMSKHPDESLSFILGLLSMQGGMDVFAGGLALDASGVAAPAGVAVNVAAVGLVASGAGVATASATKLLQQAANEDRVEPFAKDAAAPTNSAGYGGSGLGDDVTSAAANGSGNFGLGSATTDQAMSAGKAWVGDGYRVASDGKTLVSQDGLRAWRPPAYKKKLGIWQSNFEQRAVPTGRWDSNGHLDITDRQ